MTFHESQRRKPAVEEALSG